MTGYLAYGNPGYLSYNSKNCSNDKDNLLVLLIKYDPELLCPDC